MDTDASYDNLAAIQKRTADERTELIGYINRAHRALLGEDMGETALEILRKADHRIRHNTLLLDKDR